MIILLAIAEDPHILSAIQIVNKKFKLRPNLFPQLSQRSGNDCHLIFETLLTKAYVLNLQKYLRV